MRLIPKSLARVLSDLFTLPRRQSSEPSPIPGPRPLSWNEITAAADAREALRAHKLERADTPTFGKRTPEESARIRDKLAEDLAERRWRPQDANGLKFATLWNDPKAHACAPTSDAIDTREAATSAAAITLQRLGWSWRGGVEWRPPMGPMPDFDLLDKLKNEYEERLAVLDSKRQDLEERLRIAEARAEVREASCLETARHLGEIEGWKRRAREQEDHANGALNFIGWLRHGYFYEPESKPRPSLAEVIDAWQDHEEKITALVEAWADEREGEAATQIREWNAAYDYAKTLAKKSGSIAGFGWLSNWVDGHPSVTAELKKWMAENGDSGAAAMQGAAVVGRNGLPDVPIAVGRERPGAAPVQPYASGVGPGYVDSAFSTPGAHQGNIRPVR